MQQLRELQAEQGAIVQNQNVIDTPESFGNDAVALVAAETGVAVYDRTSWGRIKVTDSDRIRFLHNQSTNDFERLKPGQGCDTVFVTSTARTIDLVTAYVTEDAVLLLVSPNRRQYLIDWLDRYIFFADRVQLTDITTETAAFSLIGPESHTLVQKLGASVINQPHGNHIVVPIAGDVRVAVGSGLATPGYTMIVAAENAATLWSKIVAAGAIPLGDRVWEQLRIQQGRPAPDQELTEDYNPLEAGLWQTISFSKGCYIGQETIARLNTYKGVKQNLWGIRLNAPAPRESVITLGDEKVGKLTSYIETEQGLFGLGYIRTKAGGAGLKVNIGDSEGEIFDVPFLTHEYSDDI